VLIANYQDVNSKNIEITKTKFMQITKNQIVMHFFLFCGEAATTRKIFAAFVATKKRNSKQIDEADN